MTISQTTARVKYTGNGSTTNWPYDFLVERAEDMSVFVYTDGVRAVIPAVDFTVNINTNTDGLVIEGGSVDYTPVGGPLAANQEVVLERNTQSTLNAEINNILTPLLQRIHVILHELQRDQARTVRLPSGEDSIGDVGVAASRANKVVGFDENGDFNVDVPSAVLSSIIAQAEAARDAAQTAQTAAETAETNATTQATAAATSASNAALSFDNFDDKFLGAKATEPTLDNDGDPLVAGALFFDTTEGAMKVYTGSVWTLAYVDGTTSLLKTENLNDLPDKATARTNLGVPALTGATFTGTVNLSSGALQEAGVPISSIGKHTIAIPDNAMQAATTSGAEAVTGETTTNAVNYSGWAFDGAADEYIWFKIAMPKGWDGGTITFIPQWTTTATGTTGVAWGLQGVAVSDGDPIDAAYGTAVIVADDAQSAAEDGLVGVESAAVTIAGSPAEGDIVFFRVFRDVSDANDDMTEDAVLLSIHLLFTIDAATDA